MVFFTTSGYEHVKKDTVARLVAAGCVWPTDASNRYFSNLIAPPKGCSRSIRECFGYEERAGALQPTGTPLSKLGGATTCLILGFVIAPLEMSLLCGLGRCCRRAAWDSDAWAGSIVDARAVRPLGQKAHNHWTLWQRAQFVMAGSWAIGNVGLLMSPRFAVWRWHVTDGGHTIAAAGKLVCVSQAPIPPSFTVRMDSLTGLIALGITNTKSPASIVASLRRKSTGSKIAFVGVFLQAGATTLFYNRDMFADCPALDEGTFLTLVLKGDCVTLKRNGKFVLTAKLPVRFRS